MIQYVVIILFCYSILLFFGLMKLYDLHQDMKKAQKEQLRLQFSICYKKELSKVFVNLHLKERSQVTVPN